MTDGASKVVKWMQRAATAHRTATGLWETLQRWPSSRNRELDPASQIHQELQRLQIHHDESVAETRALIAEAAADVLERLEDVKFSWPTIVRGQGLAARPVRLNPLLFDETDKVPGEPTPALAQPRAEWPWIDGGPITEADLQEMEQRSACPPIRLIEEIRRLRRELTKESKS